MQGSWHPGDRFTEALGFAVATHAAQERKGSGVPYIGHLLAVAALVIDDGGSEDEAIAAVLHDAAEDQGGEEMLAEIGRRFGADVERIVAACSDTFEDPKPPWEKRKAAYVEAIAHKAPDELRVSLADKVANARAISSDLQEHGDALWERFNAPKRGQLWYYRALADAFSDRSAGPLARELERVVGEIETEATETRS